MSDSHAQAWKFWVRMRGHLYCFVVTVGDEEAAKKMLYSRENIDEVLDRERLPQRVYDALRLKPNEITGFKSLTY